MISCIIGFIIIYIPILLSGKMYMYLDIGADTYCSYWLSLSYAANIVEDIKLWDTSLGLGASTLIQICYFLIDPFNWIIFLFSPYNMDVGIFLSLCMKYIFLIIGAYLYFDIMGLKGLARNIAALCTTFCGWFVGWGQHYNFASMFVMFIWLLYLFERWLKQRKWLGYVLLLAYMSAMTVYYTYMSLLFLAVYYLVRYGTKIGCSDIKKVLVFSVKTALVCIGGIALASVFFLPMVGDITASARIGEKLIPSLSFASVEEYISLILRSFSSNIFGINQNFKGYVNYYECPFMYVSLLLFFLIPPILKIKENISGLIVVIFAIIFPGFVGVIFNAFSTMGYRWTYVFAPIFALGIGKGVSIWEENNYDLKTSKWSYAFIMCSIMLYCCYLMNQETVIIEKTAITSIIIVMVSATFYLLIFNNNGWRKKGKFFIYVVLLGELIANGTVSVRDRALIEQKAKESMNYFDASQNLIQYLEENDSEFYRINKKYAQIELNDSMIQHYRGEKFYSSILTPSYWMMQDLFDLRIKSSNYFYGFSDKQFLRDINCGKYMFTSKERKYYGYEEIYKCNGRYLYKNLNTIGFGFLYDNYVSESEYRALTQLEKQDILYSAAIIADEDMDKISSKISARKEDSFLSKLLPVNSKVVLDQNGITITLDHKNKKALVVEIMGNKDEVMEGNLYTSVGEDGYNTDEFITVTIDVTEPKYYNIIDLNIEQIRLDINPDYISNICIYEKDSTQVEDRIKEKANSCMNNVEYSDEYIRGNIEIEKPSILYLPIIYDTRWESYINGEQCDIIRTNGGFCSIVLPAGNNDIELVYHNTRFTIGIIISSITAMIIIVLLCYQRWLKYLAMNTQDMIKRQNT